MNYTSDYSKIDSVLFDWAKKHNLHIFKEYKDYEVRSINIVSNSGRKLYQIWIDAPDEKNESGIHAWDYKKERIDIQSSITDLSENLEKIYDAIIIKLNE